MNFIFISRDALDTLPLLRIEGERFLQLKKERTIEKGEELRLALEGLSRARAKIVQVNEDSIECEVFQKEPLPPRLPCVLIVAIPRPQTIKKVIQLSASFGVKSLELVRTENTDKSYLQSKTLREKELQEELIKALEQVGDAVFPLVRTHRSFQAAWHELAFEEGHRGFYADTRSAEESGVSQLLLPDSTCSSYTLAIGPERGWSNKEREIFNLKGFQPFSLGSRIFRVEHALLAALSQVEVLRRP